MSRPEPIECMMRQLLSYDPATGEFTWLTSLGTRRKGDVAGSINGRGYRHIKIAGRTYGAHRLAWLYVYGELPPAHTDHINRDQSDNRICNLRLATNKENQGNTTKPRHNTSGVKGVHWKCRNRKWCAQIKIDGKKRYLGLFADKNAARAAYIAAARQHFGDHWGGEE